MSAKAWLLFPGRRLQVGVSQRKSRFSGHELRACSGWVRGSLCSKIQTKLKHHGRICEARIEDVDGGFPFLAGDASFCFKEIPCLRSRRFCWTRIRCKATPWNGCSATSCPRQYEAGPEKARIPAQTTALLVRRATLSNLSQLMVRENNLINRRSIHSRNCRMADSSVNVTGTVPYSWNSGWPRPTAQPLLQYNT